MATFKAVVRTQRTDKRFLVYIRCTHNRQIDYIKTDMYVTPKGVSGNNISDHKIIAKCSIVIDKWIDRLNSEDISKWSVKDIVSFLQQGDSKIPFISYCESYIAAMINNGRERTAKNYQTALNAFVVHFGNQISFQNINRRN